MRDLIERLENNVTEATVTHSADALDDSDPKKWLKGRRVWVKNATTGLEFKVNQYGRPDKPANRQKLKVGHASRMLNAGTVKLGGKLMVVLMPISRKEKHASYEYEMLVPAADLSRAKVG